MRHTPSTRPIVLTVIDGWGVRADTGGNAIANAKTPIFDRLSARGLNTVLTASGEAVGVAPDQPGNAEAGHRTIGAGRAIPQSAEQIRDAISGNAPTPIAENRALQNLIQKTRSVGGAVHLLGLMSPAGVQGHQYHLAVLAALLSHEGIKVWIHAILDGEDSAPMSGADYLSEFLNDIEGAEHAQLGTIMGRRYALDRLARPAQLETALKALIEADAPQAEYAVPYIAGCNDAGTEDGDVPPAVSPAYRGLRQDDAVLIANFRPDSAHALVAALTGSENAPLQLERTPDLSAICSLTPMSPPLHERVTPLFDISPVTETLSDALAEAGLSQLYLSDSVNGANLGTYMRGGRLARYEGEKVWHLAPGKRHSFSKKPDLASLDMADEVVKQIKKQTFDIIIVNLPAVAIAAHTGDKMLTQKAAEYTDKALGKIAATIEKRGGLLVIAGSHGNAEDMRLDGDSRQASPGANTRNPVPFVITGHKSVSDLGALRPGRLSDIAPTLLSLLDARIPASMTGSSLLSIARADADVAV